MVTSTSLAQPRRYRTRAQTRVVADPHPSSSSSSTSTTRTSSSTTTTTTTTTTNSTTSAIRASSLSTATSSTIASSRKRTSTQAAFSSRPSSRASSTSSSSAPTRPTRKSAISTTASSRSSTIPSVLGPKPTTSRVTRRVSTSKTTPPQRTKPSPKRRTSNSNTTATRSSPRSHPSPKRAPRKKKKVTFESPQPARTPRDKENHNTTPVRAATVDRDNDVEMKGGESTPPPSPQRSILSSSSGNTSPVRSPIKSILLNSPEKLRSVRQKTADVEEEDELATALPISSPLRPPHQITRQLSPVRSVHTLLPPPKMSTAPVRNTSPVRAGVMSRGTVSSGLSNVPNLAPSMVPIRPTASPKSRRVNDSEDELSAATPFSPAKRPVKSLNFGSRVVQKTENQRPADNVMNTPARRPAPSQLFGVNKSKLAPQTPSATAPNAMATPARRPMGLAASIASARKPTATAATASTASGFSVAHPPLQINFPETEKPLVKKTETSKPTKPAEKPVKIKEEVDFGDLIRVPKRLSFGNQPIFALGKKSRQSLSKIPRRTSGASSILDMVGSTRDSSSPIPEAVIKKEVVEETIDLTGDSPKKSAPAASKAFNLMSSVSSTSSSEESSNISCSNERVEKSTGDATVDAEGDVEMSGIEHNARGDDSHITQLPPPKTSSTPSKIPVPNSTKRFSVGPSNVGPSNADSSFASSAFDTTVNVGEESHNAVHMKHQPHGRMPVTPTMNKLPGLDFETEIPEAEGRTLFGPNATPRQAAGDDSFVTDIGDDSSLMEGMQGVEGEHANGANLGNILDSSFSQPTPVEEMMRMVGMSAPQTQQIPIDPALQELDQDQEPHPLHQPQRYSAATKTSRIPVKFEPDSPPRELGPELAPESPCSIREGIIPTVTLTRGKSPKSIPAVALSSSTSSSTSSTTTTTVNKPPKDRILAGAVVFVDVHLQDGETVSERFINILKSLGAKVVKQWNWNPAQTTGPNSKVGITHVVFKDGGQRTLSKVKASRGVVNCVGIAWVIECQKQGLWVSEDNYRVDLDIRPRGGGRRRKSMEPKAALTMIDLTIDAPTPHNSQEDTDMDLADAPSASSSANYGGIHIKTEETTAIEFKTEPEFDEPRSPRRSLAPLNLPPPSEPILTPVLPDPIEDYDEDEDMDQEIDIGDRSIMISAGSDLLIPRSPSPPSSSSSDSSDNENDENSDEENRAPLALYTPPRADPVSITAPMTCPTRRGLGTNGSQMGMTPAIQERIMAARRKSMQFLPKVGSPLSRSWTAKP